MTSPGEQYALPSVRYAIETAVAGSECVSCRQAATVSVRLADRPDPEPWLRCDQDWPRLRDALLRLGHELIDRRPMSPP